MTDEEQAATGIQAKTQPAEAQPAEASATAENLQAAHLPESGPERSAAPADDGGNFGEDVSDNFGAEAEAGVPADFEDNFGLGERQLAAGTIPSPPSEVRKKPPVIPVTPRNREENEPAPAGVSGADPAKKKQTREEELFERFQLMRVPPKVCVYAGIFRAWLAQHPDALKDLEPLLSDEASVAAVHLGMKRLNAFPDPEFASVMFYYPVGMMTEAERKDWDAHMKKFPEYAALANGRFPYFDAPQFYYRHGAVYLDPAVTDRLAGGIFYQCGAFCGASLIVMNQYKPGKMYAFEPSAGNAKFLQANVARAKLKNAEIYRLCIADREGKVVMPVHDANGLMQKTEVPAANLDLFEQRKAVKGRVAWIQADVNGMGLRVIKGAEKMIKRDKPLITVAIYHDPEEFFGIAPLLHEWVPEYKFMVRRCQCNPSAPYVEITLIAYVP